MYVQKYAKVIYLRTTYGYSALLDKTKEGTKFTNKNGGFNFLGWFKRGIVIGRSIVSNNNSRSDLTSTNITRRTGRMHKGQGDKEKTQNPQDWQGTGMLVKAGRGDRGCEEYIVMQSEGRTLGRERL